jgi:hypothetical protein
MTIYETLDSTVTALEARRKKNPHDFFSAPGKPHLNEPGFKEVSKLETQLRTFLKRLEKLE